MFCHGNPESGDHCCYVGGATCPNLLTGQALTDAVQAQVDLYNFKGPVKTLAEEVGSGVTFACHVAIKVIAEWVDANGGMIDRASFEANWAAHPDYADVGASWLASNLPFNYCVTYGPSQGQCCFSEDEALNATKGAAVPVNIRTLRQAINGG